jgi:hypothetical protein
VIVAGAGAALLVELAGRLPGTDFRTEFSTPAAGFRAAGFRAAGSRAAGSRAAGSRAAGSRAAGSRAAGSRAAGIWATDRIQGRLIGLDASLRPRVSIPVDSPRFVAARRGGGAWVATDPRTGTGEGEILLFDGEGSPRRRRSVGRVKALACLEGGDAVVIAEDLVGTPPGEGADLLVRLSPEGGVRKLLRLEGATCIAVAASQVLVGRRGGGVMLLTLSPSPALLRWGLGDRDIVQVAAGREGWWALEAGEEVQVHRLDATLHREWSRSTGWERAVLAVAPGHDSAWVVEAAGGEARRLGAEGDREEEVFDLPRLAIAAASADVSGAVTLASGGALLRLEANGRLLLTRGGFGSLSDLDQPGW